MLVSVLSPRPEDADEIVATLAECPGLEVKSQGETTTQITIGENTFTFFREYEQEGIITALSTLSIADVGVVVLSAKTAFQHIREDFEDGGNWHIDMLEHTEYNRLVNILCAFSAKKYIAVLVTDLDNFDNLIKVKEQLAELNFKLVKSMRTTGVYANAVIQMIPYDIRNKVNICKESEEASLSQVHTLQDFLSFIPPMVRIDERSSAVAKLVVLESERSGSTVTSTVFLMNGVLSEDNKKENFKSCPEGVSIEALMFTDLDSTDLSNVDSGKIFQIEGQLKTSSGEVCSDKDFRCPRKLGRGSLITVSSGDKACPDHQNKKIYARFTLGRNLVTIERENIKYELIFAGSSVYAEVDSIVDEFDPRTQKVVGKYLRLMGGGKSYHVILTLLTPGNIYYHNGEDNLSSFIIRKMEGPVIGFGSFLRPN